MSAYGQWRAYQANWGNLVFVNVRDSMTLLLSSAKSNTLGVCFECLQAILGSKYSKEPHVCYICQHAWWCYCHYEVPDILCVSVPTATIARDYVIKITWSCFCSGILYLVLNLHCPKYPQNLNLTVILFDKDWGCVSIRFTNKKLRPVGVDKCRSWWTFPRSYKNNCNRLRFAEGLAFTRKLRWIYLIMKRDQE